MLSLIQAPLSAFTATCYFFFPFFYRMRDTARKIEEKYFSNLATHAEFLPVEWRSKLTLDGGTLLKQRLFCCSSSKIVPRSLVPWSLHVPCWDVIVLLCVIPVSLGFFQTPWTPLRLIKYEVCGIC